MTTPATMTVADHASMLARLAQQQFDRVVSPSARREAWNRGVELAVRNPGLFTFIALLVALSLPPIILFLTFVLLTALLSLSAAILFSLFWTGLALLILVPSLFIAAGFGIVFWTWAVGSFIAARWLVRRAGLDLGSPLTSDGYRHHLQEDGRSRDTGTWDVQFENSKKDKELDHLGPESDT